MRGTGGTAQAARRIAARHGAARHGWHGARGPAQAARRIAARHGTHARTHGTRRLGRGAGGTAQLRGAQAGVEPARADQKPNIRPRLKSNSTPKVIRDFTSPPISFLTGMPASALTSATNLMGPPSAAA